MTDTWDAWERLSARRHQHAVPHDRFDVESWVEARKEMPSLQDLYLEFTARFDCAPEFLQDFFLLLLKGDPRVRPAGEMAPAYIPNRQMIDRFSQYDELLSLRDHTSNHLYAAMLAMLSMRSELEAAFEAMELARRMAQELQERMDQARELAARARELIESADETDPDRLAELAEIEIALEELLGTLVQLEDNATEAADQAAGQVMLLLRAAADGTARELDSQAALAHEFGISPGELQRKDYAERVALMKRLNNNRIRKFSALIGAMREAADASLRKRIHGVPSEVVGLELGDDLARLASDELVTLATPELEVDFLLRFLERRLAVWAVRGTERAGKGPLIVVCDESGSMEIEDIGHVSREAWSKALTLALARLAQAMRRPMFYIGFSSEHQQWSIDLSRPGFEAAIEMTEHFFSGGTSYERPLEMALYECRTRFDAKRFGQADIVFITDDAYAWMDSDWVETFNRERGRLGVRVHGVLIGEAVSDFSTMQQVCDSVRTITGVLAGDEVSTAATLFPAAL